ncbi:hypothetical protein OG723_38010 [Streptomyces sp. NBC_01278]|nr:hypothetical protein OG573_31250 [Streptomyces sp. NBC_01205]
MRHPGMVPAQMADAAALRGEPSAGDVERLREVLAHRGRDSASARS